MKTEVKILKALADQTRFKIVIFLLNGQKSVSEITADVKKAQPTVSLQLKLLELSGVLESERRGKQVFYKITNQKVRAVVKALGVKS